MTRIFITMLLVGCGEDKTTDSDTSPNEDACEQYIACVSTATPADLGDAIDTYGDEGSCWDEDAALCDAACDAGLDQLRETYADPACWDASCGEFMAWWTSQCGQLADGRWCDDEYAAWRTCTADAAECDPDACLHLLPLADGAVFQLGQWQTTWSVTDYEQCFTTDEPEEALAALGLFTLRGNGTDQLSLSGNYVVKAFPFELSADCAMNGADFSCTTDSAITTGWSGSFDSPTQASIQSVQATKPYCTFDLRGTMVPVH